MSRAALIAMSLVACGGDGASAGAVTAVTSLEQCEPARPIADDRVVARWEGGEVTFAQLRERTGTQLRAMDIQHQISRYELQAQALDGLVLERLLEAEARRLGHANVDALLDSEIERRIPAPTDAEIADFYPVVARQLGGATLEESRPLLVQELLRRKKQDAFAAYLEELKGRASLSAELPYPDLPRIAVPVGADDPVRGAADAPVTIVQFAEYQCYYCNKVNPTLDRILEEYEGKVRVVFKDFPLSGHSRALPAAIAAHCAGAQGKYWEMNRVLLENQHALGDGDLVRYATELALEPDEFRSCLGSGRFDAVVQRGLEQGKEAGVNATPAFFINGITLSGAQPYERFRAIVDEELTGAAAQ